MRASGGTVPDVLQCLLSSYDVLTAPRPADASGDAVMDAAMAGKLDAKTLDKLIGPAAIAAMTNQFRAELVGRAERVLVGAWHRAMTADVADQILDGLRPAFTKHADAIEYAKTWINAESSTEHLIASGEPELVTVWNALDGHIQAVSRIGKLASDFGSKSTARFGQVREFGQGDVFRVSDLALMCCTGSLVADSAPFLVPDGPHRASAWFRVGSLRLNSISEARERYAAWAAAEHDRIYADADRGGWIDQATGEVHKHPVPENPYRTRELAK